ncbi:MAG TPA: hypothetical protein VHG91_02945 [Longimicrobium sp.]|nr:hypothetical protein [Longimicrobium sp.]
MKTRLRLLKGAAVLPVLLAAACADRHPTTAAPSPEAPVEPLAKFQCAASTKSEVVACTLVSMPPLEVSYDRILGGQNQYIRMASSGVSYDPGTQIFSFNATVQNLTSLLMGTTDGTTVSGAGVKAYFPTAPTVTSGTGSVTAANADGLDGTLPGPNNVGTFPYYAYWGYGEILSPYEISSARQWQLNVPSTVVTFSFTVLIAAPMVNESAPLTDLVWDGSFDTAWDSVANWTPAQLPSSTRTVSIPAAASITSGNLPQLNSNAAALHVGVGTGSTIDLNAFSLTAGGNVDVVGAISGGTLEMSGTGVLLRGTIPSLVVSGSTSLQGSTKATGAVSVTGTLTVKDQALNVAIP